jgi:SNF2 family DNA or RNA helicase
MPYAEIDFSADPRITVATQWTEKDQVKEIPGSRWNAEDKMWKLPLTYTACVQLKGVFGESLQVGPKLTEWIWNEWNLRIKNVMSIRELTGIDILHIDPRLYHFQEVGVQFLLWAGSALLADEMGTGKTIQVLATMAEIGADALPALVICPNSVKTHWVEEAKTWLPQANTYALIGSAAEKNKLIEQARADPKALVIVNFESTYRLSRLAGFGSIRLARCTTCDKAYGIPGLKPTSCEVHPRALNQVPFKLVVVDEAHRIKDPKAKQTRAVWALGCGSSVSRRWGLTGTPLANDPSDLWSIMHFVAPNEYPTKSKFVDRYCLMAWNSFGGLDVVGLNPATKTEFYKFFDPRFRRMSKALVLRQLPPKIYTRRMVEMSPKQKKAYKEIERQLVTRLENGDVLVAKSNLSAQVRLLQLSSSYATITTGEDPNDLTQWEVTLTDPSPKVNELMEVLAELGDKPCVVSAEQRKLIELAAKRLEKAGIRYGLITGAVDEYERQVALDDLQKGRIRVLLFTLKAGGTGLTMTAVDTMVRLQRSWSMIDNKQGEDRVHRIGSERHDAINIIDIITEDTIEETQLIRLYAKTRRLEEITRDREALAREGRSIAHLDEEESKILSSNLGLPE